MKLVKGHLVKSNLMSRVLHQASYRLSQGGCHNLSEASLDVETAQKNILNKILAVKYFFLCFVATSLVETIIHGGHHGRTRIDFSCRNI